MISVITAKFIHHKLIGKYGGSDGIRDLNLLESALARPFATFDGCELYDIFEKAAAIIESILINHPFIDGNKRTGYAIAKLLLAQNGYKITAQEDEKYDFVISITEGKLKHSEIAEWFKKYCIKI